MFQSRVLTAADIRGLTSWLGRLPLYERYGFAGETARSALTAALEAGDLLLVCDAEGSQAVGLAWCLKTGAFGRSPYLRLLAVRDDYAGQGCGGRLLEDLEAALAAPDGSAHRGAGTTDLYLLVSDFNTAAQRFYQRHGYSQVGRLDEYVLPGVAELLYRKPLAAPSHGSRSSGR